MAKKTFPHAVIYNGAIIPANTPIEIAEKKATDETTKAETVKKPAKKAVKSDDNN